ncbi:MAG: transposase [Phycisphaerae bacterium]|jgi:putative transposase
MSSEPPLHRKQCRRYDEPWQAHYLTFSCFRRQPFFKARFSPGWFVEILHSAREEGLFDLWAYVIMPEHVHLVILPAEGQTISGILRRLKRPMTTRVLAWVRANQPSFLERMTEHRPSGQTHHRFWQTGGGYDRNLRSAEEIHEKIKYVHLNPLRRGLVSRLEDWPWSSYRAWELGVDEPVRLDRESVPILVN